MKAIGYKTPGPLNREDALLDINLPRPTASGRDLLVEVQAVSVNPVDYKLRMGMPPAPGCWKVLGWDAVGVIVETGPRVEGFSPGDEVYYAGSFTRDGTNCQFHLVDERLVAKKPASLSTADAAAFPLTALTAWEMLFDRLDVARPVPGAAPAVLIIGGAGGVGSIAIQLLRALTDLIVIATASRPETKEWVENLGAHHVIDHTQPLGEQVEALGIGAPAFVFSTNATEHHLPEIAKLIAPQGRFGLIDDPETLDILPLKFKSVSTHWEFMFTRSMFQTGDMARQGEILSKIATLVDQGKVRTTMTQELSPISARTLKQAHAILETGRSMGKVVLVGF